MGDALWMVEHIGGSALRVGKILVFWGGVRLSAPPPPPGKGQNMSFFGPTQCFQAVRPHGSSTSYKKKVFRVQKTPEEFKNINGKQIGHRQGGAQT